jgi:hypothetical protein
MKMIIIQLKIFQVDEYTLIKDFVLEQNLI